MSKDIVDPMDIVLDAASAASPLVAAFNAARRGADFVTEHMGPGGVGQYRGSSGYVEGQRHAQLAATQHAARDKRQAAIEIKRNAAGSGKKDKVSGGVITNRARPVMRDTIYGERPMIGSELIPSLQRNQLPGIILKLGKQLGSLDVISPFLKNLCQSGTVSCQYAGRFKSSGRDAATHPLNFQGERMYVSQNFRHCWSDNPFSYGDTTTPYTGSYPVVAGNTNLGPTGDTPVEYPQNSAATNQFTVTSPYWEHTTGDNNFSIISRPDLEDMMWNLNKLKLVPNSFGFQDAIPNYGQQISTADEMMFRNVADVQVNRHYRTSRVFMNNDTNADVPSTLTAWTESAYKYNCCLKSGSVKYQFKNCESTGARVEVIVYKQKKGRYSSDKSGDFSSANLYLRGRPLDNIVPIIGDGYVNTVFDKAGTENLQGRDPVRDDIAGNPTFPFLPELKKTKQGELRFKELQRVCFALPSGGRRTLDIQLPGDEYDPCNLPRSTMTESLTTGLATYPIMDDHCYTIVISVCGVKMSRNAPVAQYAPTVAPPDNGLPYDNLIGEIHCGFNVEYNCTYTEKIAGVKYKSPKNKTIFNNGILTDTSIAVAPTNTIKTIGQPVTVIPIDHAVRNTNKVNIQDTSAPGTIDVSQDTDTGLVS